jgi:hypothetical protein
MIERLTPEQTARFPEFVEKWTKIGLSTEPADRPRAEAAIRLIYENNGVLPPEKIVWFDSPTAMFVEYKNTDNESIYDLSFSSAVSNAVNTVYDSVQDTVLKSVNSAVSTPVGNVV